ncbi:MAG: hypothetical protein ABEJ73_06980 [Haloplanus sp.]
MTDTRPHPGLHHVTVVPSNYGEDDTDVSSLGRRPHPDDTGR